MSAPTVLAVATAFAALMSSVVTASIAIMLQRQVRQFAFVADREEKAALAAADRLRATQAAVDRLAAAVAGSQGWFWSPEWQEGEREADTDLAEARFTRFSSDEELDAALAQVPSDLATSR